MALFVWSFWYLTSFFCCSGYGFYRWMLGRIRDKFFLLLKGLVFVCVLRLRFIGVPHKVLFCFVFWVNLRFEVHLWTFLSILWCCRNASPSELGFFWDSILLQKRDSTFSLLLIYSEERFLDCFLPIRLCDLDMEKGEEGLYTPTIHPLLLEERKVTSPLFSPFPLII